MVMNYTMGKTIKQSIFNVENAKSLLNSIVNKFVKIYKAKKGYYLSFLEKINYDGVGDVDKHIFGVLQNNFLLNSMLQDILQCPKW